MMSLKYSVSCARLASLLVTVGTSSSLRYASDDWEKCSIYRNPLRSTVTRTVVPATQRSSVWLTSISPFASKKTKFEQVAVFPPKTFRIRESIFTHHLQGAVLRNLFKIFGPSILVLRKKNFKRPSPEETRSTTSRSRQFQPLATFCPQPRGYTTQVPSSAKLTSSIPLIPSIPHVTHLRPCPSHPAHVYLDLQTREQQCSFMFYRRHLVLCCVVQWHFKKWMCICKALAVVLAKMTTSAPTETLILGPAWTPLRTGTKSFYGLRTFEVN